MPTSDAILDRFRAVSLERMGRIEVAWNHITVDGTRSTIEIMREVTTLTGDASMVGDASVFHLCQKLEDLVQLVEQQRFELSEDLELVVTMAIQFVCMLLRGQRRAMAGLDLFGFIRQVDDVLRESRTLGDDPGAVPRRRTRTIPPPPLGEHLGEDTRYRLAVVATTMFLEGLVARDAAARARLHGGWTVLKQDLARLDLTACDPAVVRRLRVHRFLVPGGALPLAVSARWALVLDAGRDAPRPVLLDPLAALGLGVSEPRHAEAFRLRWGFLEVAIPALAAPSLVTAERVCPTPDSHPAEVITIEGREALLVRPEHLHLSNGR